MYCYISGDIKNKNKNQETQNITSHISGEVLLRYDILKESLVVYVNSHNG